MPPPGPGPKPVPKPPRRPSPPPRPGGGPELPAPSVLESIIAGGAEAPDAIKKAASLKSATERAAKLRESAKTKSAKELVAEAARAKAAPLETSETNALGDRLTPEGKAQPAIVDTVKKFNTYTTVEQQIESGVKKADALSAAGLSEADYTKLRTEVLGNMANMQIVKDLMPEIATLPASEQADIVEAYLGKNGKVRSEMMKRVRKVIEESEGIPPAPKTPDAAPTAPDAKPQLEADQQKIIDRIRKRLAGTGTRLSETDVTEIKNLFDGRTNDEVTLDVFDMFLGKTKVAKPKLVREYGTLVDRPAQIDTQINGITTELAAMGAKLTSPADIDRTTQLTKLRTQLEGEKTQAQNRVAEIVAAKLVTPDDLSTYKALKEKVYGEIAPDGKRLPGIQSELAALGENISTIDKLPTSPVVSKSAELTPDEVQQAQKRERMQGELARNLEDAMTESVREGFDDMVKNASEMQDRHLEAARLDAVDAENQREVDAISAIAKGRDQYREWNPKTRKFTVHRKTIATDVRYIAGKGEEGVKRLILRDLVRQNIISLEGKDGKPIKGKNWENVDVSRLKDSALVEKMYAEHGDTVSSRLLTEFVAARGKHDIHILGADLGTLALNKHEYKALDEQFGEGYNQALADRESPPEGESLKPKSGSMIAMFALAGLPITALLDKSDD